MAAAQLGDEGETVSMYSEVMDDVLARSAGMLEQHGLTSLAPELRQRWASALRATLDERLQLQQLQQQQQQSEQFCPAPLDSVVKAEPPSTVAAGDDGDETLEGLDDDETALDGEADAPAGASLALCLYEKVKRVKSKWRVTLRDGLLLPDGANDVFFTRINAEFHF